MADGPVIQRASERALRNPFGIAEILEIVKEARKATDVPIILFSYFNPLMQFCINQKNHRYSAPASPDFGILARAARAAGIDGVLATDLAPEEADEFAAALRAEDLDLIFLVAPTS